MKMTDMKKIDVVAVMPRRIFSRRTFYILATMFFIILFSYAYLLTSITVNTAEARSIDIELKEMMSDVATLEVQYLASVNDLDMDRVIELGYKEIKNVKFAYTKEAIKSVAVLAE